jgi:1,2-dihydroxy-3-keto-5-methylthiopentene dioxygenase
MFSRLTLPLLFSAMATAMVAEKGNDMGIAEALIEKTCVKGVEPPKGFNGHDWPALYRLTSPDPEDPMQENFDLSTTVDPSVLAQVGVRYEFIDPTGFDYPNATAEVPWSPPDGGNNDVYVQEIRDENDYQYADIIVVTSFFPGFWDEHLHEATTIRYMIDGSGYFDLRDVDDEWVRIPVSAGDWFEWPAGIDHRFSVDEEAYIQAMRLYKGSSSPEWTAVPRSAVAGNNTARNAYVGKCILLINRDLQWIIKSELVHDLVICSKNLRF